eukprot:3028770-Pyramimonas_sp.AAC.1
MGVKSPRLETERLISGLAGLANLTPRLLGGSGSGVVLNNLKPYLCAPRLDHSRLSEVSNVNFRSPTGGQGRTDHRSQLRERSRRLGVQKRNPLPTRAQCGRRQPRPAPEGHAAGQAYQATHSGQYGQPRHSKGDQNAP